MVKYYFDEVRPQELETVSRITFSDPHLAYRLPAILRRSQMTGRLLACRNPHRTLIGWVEIYPLWRRDWGMSTLYVLPNWRGQGLATHLLKLANQKLSTKRVFTATSHPAATKVLLSLHYLQIDFWEI